MITLDYLLSVTDDVLYYLKRQYSKPFKLLYGNAVVPGLNLTLH